MGRMIEDYYIEKSEKLGKKVEAVERKLKMYEYFVVQLSMDGVISKEMYKDFIKLTKEIESK